MPATPSDSRAPISVLVAPNAFKGTVSAQDAARALAEGVRRAWPGVSCRELPLADGGDGFLDALAASPGSRVSWHQVAGPLLGPVSARVVHLNSGAAAVELAETSGLRLVPRPGPDTALRATTSGLGELIGVALRGGSRRVVIGLGGSASSDGGAGLAQALGVRFLDRRGGEVHPGGRGLLELDRIETGASARLLAERELVAACDVDSPLLGPLGAAATFGPQKGAGPDEVVELERGLARLAELAARDLGPTADPQAPGMGAAGGTAFGLAALLGARLQSGVALVAELAGLDGALGEADLVLTGEGRFDQTSLRGKVPGEVLRRAARQGLPAVVVAGSFTAEAAGRAVELGAEVLRAGEGRPPEDRLAALAELRQAGERACRGRAAELAQARRRAQPAQ